MTFAMRMADLAVAGLWQGLVLMAVVAISLRMVPRLGAAARFSVWGAAFAAAVAVPLVHLPGHAAGGESVRVGSAWGLAVAGCWAGLAVWRLGRLAGQALRLRQIWLEASPVAAEPEIADLLRTMPREPVLCVSVAVDAPSVIGFFSPKLLIPAWQIGALGESELRQIILHECEHLRRRDDWINLAQKLMLALFPLNPALLWADRRLSLEREMACDAGVVARTQAPYDYAACLTRLAEQRLGRRNLALALSAWAGESELGRRVVRLLRPVRMMSLMQRRVSVGLLSVMVAGGGMEMARFPRLVSFADGAGQVAAESVDAVEHVPADVAGRMMPVAFREPSRVLSSTPKGRVVSGKRVRAARYGVKRNGIAGRLENAASQPRLVVQRERVLLTSAGVGEGGDGMHSGEPAGVRLLDAVQIVEPGAYAAVPFANGWLLLQL